ncbi:sugar ABC transporter ATP-binding protein [Pseudonocardia acaciae]|uniref:sugar ABC transporter ATP-binding protein n=1 Tax=Pseudonocardia acaciae TaxID=551276 RepID=UPI00048E902E|nr:sugar ABC transporter ATP-binding protein [Pseudonocardia acaciae]
MSDQSPLVTLAGIGKRYGSTWVLRDINLDFAPGHCTALVGENGAGKSTLVGVMSGTVAPTEGTLAIEGRTTALRSPRDGRAQGIGLIPQELAYVPDLTVAENIMLANWPRGRAWAPQRWMRRRAGEILDELDIRIDVRRRMAELPLAERQLVEVAKALASDVRLLILDEPTASLYAHETRTLLRHLHRLKQRGTCLVYVSHHLDECFEIGDRVAVLRNGGLVDLSPTGRTSPARTVSAMLGRDYAEPATLTGDGAAFPVAMEVSGWSRERRPALREVSFGIREGEVLGVFGLVGSGVEAVARGLGGDQAGITGSLVTGSVRRPVPRSPRRARRLSIGYVPSERKTEGLALSQSVAEHLTMMVIGRFARLGWMRSRAQARAGRELAERFDVRCRAVGQEVEQLSGGNQQKVLVASRMAAAPKVLVLHEPTRGVDIGSRAQIHRMLTEFARAGSSVVLVTSDLQEAVGATDRLIVLRDGRVVAELAGDEKTGNRALALAAAGGHHHD